MKKKFPSKRDKGGNDLVDVPSNVRLVKYRYRGEIRRIPDFLHPDLRDFDDIEDDALEIFLFCGRIPRSRLEFEQRYAP
jgi:hypothetical protein